MPTLSSDRRLATKATLWLVKLAKEVVLKLFEKQRAEVQKSWDTLLDKEEALAYLVAYALGCELLPEEARRRGPDWMWREDPTVAFSQCDTDVIHNFG